MLHMLFSVENAKLILLLGMVFAFALTALLLKYCRKYLPTDAGRDFAVGGKLTAGRPRGAGLYFVLIFAVSAFLFLPLNLEAAIFIVLIIAAMMTGFLDDASSTPWDEYKKGLLDLIIAVLTAVTYINFNGSDLHLAFFGTTVHLNPILYGVLAVILVWASINVTNCSDGVDALSSTVSIVTLLGILGVNLVLRSTAPDNAYILLFVAVLLAYLWFNAHPNCLMMGDAGSRAMGLFIAIAVLKTGSPILYLPLALILILDGGLGLIKVSLLRFLKIKILANVRTPIHDHMRKNKGWSDEQVVVRFAVIQAMIAVCVFLLVR